MKLRTSVRPLLLAAMLLLVLLPVPAAAQAEVSFSTVLVDIWPEYDQPTVLVMNNITLAPTVALPATLRLRIPAGAGRPHALAMQDVSGLYDLNYELVAASEWIEVLFTTPVPDIRLEYYDPGIQKDGAQRSFRYRWPGNYAVQNLTIRVQQPLGAAGMIFRPDIGQGRPDTDGLNYYTLVAGQVNAGSAFDLDMSYNKDSDALTSPQQFQPALPNQPVDGSTSGRITLFQGLSMTPLQLGMLALGLALIVGGIFWFWLTSSAGRGRASRRGAGRRRHASASAAPGSRGGPAAPDETDLESVYCHQCGKKSGPGDIFCRACGTELR